MTLPSGPGGPPPPGLPQKAYFHDVAFLAQKDLENKQRQESGELFRNFERLQEQEITELEDEIKRQMERAVDQLFMQMDSGRTENFYIPLSNMIITCCKMYVT